MAHTGYRCKHEDKQRSSDQQTQHRAQTEQAAIATVIQRLSMQFPEVPQQNIREAACGEFVDFKTSKDGADEERGGESAGPRERGDDEGPTFGVGVDAGGCRAADRAAQEGEQDGFGEELDADVSFGGTLHRGSGASA